MSVAQVALRYTVNANHIFKWLRDPRHVRVPVSVPSSSGGSLFLPVENVAAAKVPVAAPVADKRIEIDLAGGHRMQISGGHDPKAWRPR